MQNFGTAKTVLTIMMIIGWAVVGLAVVVLFNQSSGFGVQARIVGAAMTAIWGAIMVATAQMGMTSIATTENTRDMLQIMRGQAQMALTQIATAENTRDMLQIMRGQNSSSASATGRSLPTHSPKATSQVANKIVGGRIIKVYKGREIKEADFGVSVEGIYFSTVIEAEKWISTNSGN